MTQSEQVLPRSIRVTDVDLRHVRKSRLSDEFVRPVLAYAFAAILGVTVIASFGGVWFIGWTGIKDWLQVVLPAESALLGSAVGFYFGTRHKG